MEKETNYEKAEAYLLNKLSDEEHMAFEAEMQSNPILAEEVAIMRDVMQATGEEDIRAFRSILETAAGTVEKKRPEAKLFSLRWPLLTAAAVVVLLISVWFMYNKPKVNGPVSPMVKTDSSAVKEQTIQEEKQVAEQDQQIKESAPVVEKGQQKSPENSPEKPDPEYIALAEKLYSPYDVSGRRGQEEEQIPLTNLQQAVQAYSDEQWEKAIALLQNPDSDQPTESLKLRAHAYFRDKKFANAVIDFQELAKSSIFYKDDAEWNLLLCYLAQLPSQQSAFNTLAKKITSDKDHSFYEMALDLKKYIK